MLSLLVAPLSVAANFQSRDQQQINKFKGAIFGINRRDAAVRRIGQELRMIYGQCLTIAQADDEGTKGLGVVNFA